MKKIAVLGGNPAKQKTLFFERFDAGKINRATEIRLFAAGKGVNFCRAVRILGSAETELIQFAGGANGRFVCAELDREHIPHRTTWTAHETRCCTTCLDGVSMTEIIDPSFSADEAEVTRLLADFSAALQGAAGAAFTGTLPGKTDPALFVRAAEAAAQAKVPLLLDAYRGIEPVLDSGAEIWLKINRDELAELTGISGVHSGLRWLYGHFPLRYAAITDGPSTAYATDGTELFKYTLPRLPEVVNPIGCGDTASGTMMAEMLNGIPLAEAFRRALAAASANCLSALPGSFRKEDWERIAKEIVFDSSILG